jgi:glycerol-3-phosphate dehydrogenase
MLEQIVIVGGGGTGGALAHDLTLRGFRVTLFEKGELLSGTTGRHHGLLHSGARYAVNDPAAAVECIEENRILRIIAPEAFEQNDGLFVALDEEDMAFRPLFLEGCRACEIPAEEMTPAAALALEPGLHPGLKSAVRVPDATMDAWRLPMHFFATARINGADIRPFTEVVGFQNRNSGIEAVEIVDHRTGSRSSYPCDMVVNAAGPWAGRVAGLAGLSLPLQPGPGVMVAVEGRVTNMVINRLRPADEGDIIIPQRRLSLLGTTLWLAKDPDVLSPPADHHRRIIDLCGRLVPAVRAAPVRSVWWAVRPLMTGGDAIDPQAISRDFGCIDHSERDHREGLISVIGGKATTLRAMAETAADLICKKTGRSLACRTRESKLLSYRLFYK